MQTASSNLAATSRSDRSKAFTWIELLVLAGLLDTPPMSYGNAKRAPVARGAWIFRRARLGASALV